MFTYLDLLAENKAIEFYVVPVKRLRGGFCIIGMAEGPFVYIWIAHQ